MGSYRRTTPLKTTSATGDLVVRTTQAAVFVSDGPPMQWTLQHDDMPYEHRSSHYPVPRVASHHYANYSHATGNTSTFYLY